MTHPLGLVQAVPLPTHLQGLKPEDARYLEHLRMCLETSVPLWIARLKRHPGGLAYVLHRARECSQAVAEHGDILQFGSKKKGQTGEAFNRLAEGVAAVALVAGSCTLFGLRFEAPKGNAEL